MTDSPFLSEFESAWELYPRKTAKQDAFRAFTARRRAGTSAENLATATANYAKSRTGQDPHYTMLGATFFGPSERWKDYLDPASASPPAPLASDPPTRRDYDWDKEFREREVAEVLWPAPIPKMSESTQDEGRRWIAVLREEHNLLPRRKTNA